MVRDRISSRPAFAPPTDRGWWLRINGAWVGPFANRTAALAHYRWLLERQQVIRSAQVWLGTELDYVIV